MTAPVVVVGAGPVGLTAALLLSSHDVPCLVLDRRAPPPAPGTGPVPVSFADGSRAVVTQRSSLDTWRRGDPWVAEALHAVGVSWRRKETWHRDRFLFADEYRTDPAAAPPFLNVPQPTVEHALRRALGSSRLVEFRWDTEVTGVRQDDSAVTLATADGLVRARWVVAADGPRSTVRRGLGVGLPSAVSRHWFVIADVRDVRSEFPFDPGARRFHYAPPGDPEGHLLVMPQPQGVWRLDWQSPRRRDLAADLASGEVAERVDRAVGGAPAHVEWVSQYRFHNGVADAFRVGRVLLAGDSCHRLSPFGGRGMNSGVADAAAAATAVARALSRPADAETALDRYARVRRGQALENVAATSRVLRVMEPRTPTDRVARRVALAVAPHSTRARRYLDNGAYRSDSATRITRVSSGRTVPRHRPTTGEEPSWRSP
jgi:3-(3-hydroxy-phenyl)propionate hydroxylase